MSALKPGIAAIVLIAGFSTPSLAQGVVRGSTTAGGYAPYPGPGSNNDYYTISPGFGTYGLPGTYPNYDGHGLSGYGPGAALNGYFVAGSKDGTQQTYKGNIQTYNNIGGVTNSIKKATVKPYGSGNSTYRGVTRPRAAR